ncbi:MAG: ABC transporter substrate-binding protein [Myxococcota bacterium]|nr:ABC transporter substrate-binding protein [Myxococcota bacterium]
MKHSMTGLLVIAAMLAGCGDGAGTPTAGSDGDGPKIFYDRRGTAHKTLDPPRQFDSASADIIMNVYDTLLEYHYLARPYRMAPNLLSELPEKQEDGKTYVFRLRKGIHFHDDACFEGGKGRELVADDAIYSIQRFADANVNIKSWVLLAGYIEGLDDFRDKSRAVGKDIDYAAQPVSGLRKLDSHSLEVEFTRDTPLALFPFAMTSLSIVPREAVEKYGEDFAQHPVGTGPFTIKRFSRRGTMILARNPNYHGTYPAEGAPDDAENGLLAYAGRQTPFLDEVHMPLIEEAQPAMLKFRKAELDWIGINKDDFPNMAYKAEDGSFHLKDEYARLYHSYVEPGLSAEYFSFNLRDSLWRGEKGKALRQAIAWSIDTPAFIELLSNGRGLPMATIVPQTIAGNENDIGFSYYQQDREKARQKLAEAGYPEGRGLPEIHFEYRSATKDARQGFEFIRNELAAVGIRAKANFNTFSAFLKKIESGNFQVASAGWAADYPDGENFYQLLYSPNKTPGPNSSTFNHPEYDALYEQIRSMPNGPERFAIFRRMSEIIKDEVPLLLRFNGLAFGIYQRNVRNLKRHMLVEKAYKYLDKVGSPVL